MEQLPDLSDLAETFSKIGEVLVTSFAEAITSVGKALQELFFSIAKPSDLYVVVHDSAPRGREEPGESNLLPALAPSLGSGLDLKMIES